MTYRDQLQLLDYFNANHRLKDTIKGIIQMLLEHYCVWGNNHLARKPVLVFDYCHSSDFLLTSSLDLPVCNFVQFPCVCWGKIAEEKKRSQVYRTMTLLLLLLYSKLGNPSILSHSSQSMPSTPFNQLCCPPAPDTSEKCNILFILWSPYRHTVFEVNPQQC